MKRIIFYVGVVISCVALTGCGDDSSTNAEKYRKKLEDMKRRPGGSGINISKEMDKYNQLSAKEQEALVD